MLKACITCDGTCVGIDGKWRLVFSTSTKLRVFQYIPVIEDLVIDLSAEKISLESAMGPFQFLISGVTFGFDQDKAALDFQFKDVEVLFLGKKVGKHGPCKTEQSELLQLVLPMSLSSLLLPTSRGSSRSFIPAGMAEGPAWDQSKNLHLLLR